MDHDKFVSLVHSLSVTSLSLNERDLSMVYSLADVFSRYTSLKWERLLAAYPEAPSLSVYMSDGWSADVSSWSQKFIGQHVVRRRGKLRWEFLLQRGLLKILTGDDRIEIAVKLSEPICLGSGRKAWSFFTAGCDFLPVPRHFGARGITISVHLYDGALFSPLRKHFTARNELYYSDDYGIETGPLRPILQATDWILGVQCVSHGCSNAVVWGLKTACPSVDRESVHVSIASLLNGRTALHSHTTAFLTRHLQFSAVRSGVFDDIYTFWQALDVEPGMCEIFAKLDPVWDGVNFCVNQEYETKVGGIDDILACISYLLHWAAFSETRWANVGRSGRLFARSLAGGLEPLWAICMEDENISHWHLGGLRKRLPMLSSICLLLPLARCQQNQSCLKYYRTIVFYGTGASGGGRW